MTPLHHPKNTRYWCQACGYTDTLNRFRLTEQDTVRCPIRACQGPAIPRPTRDPRKKGVSS